MTPNIMAVAPASGLRVSSDPDMTTVSISLNDHGGRGWPWAVIFIPVIQVAHKFHAVIPSRSGPPPYLLSELFEVAHWMPQSDQIPPYKMSVRRSDWENEHQAAWPFDNDPVLALLLYFQPSDIGDEPLMEAVQAPADAHVPNEYHPFGTPVGFDWAIYWRKVTKAVNDRLACSSVDALRGGVISRRAGTATPVAGARLRAEKLSSALMPSVTFSLASCQYPSDIFDRMPDDAMERGPADASLLALGELLPKADGPSLLLFVGDQVYIDATAGLFDPKIKDDRYRLPYEHKGESRGSKAALQFLGVDVHMIPDDHEISDNWDPGDPTPTRGTPAIELGKKAYWDYQRFDSASDTIWRKDIVHRELPFFLGDTRTERQGRTAMNWTNQKIMADDQFDALCKWMVIEDRADLPKFVATASAVLPRRLAVARDPACALHSDAWDGYPKSMHDLLAHVCDNEIKGLVFLSGDEHISNWVQARVTDLATGKCCTLHSVHSSALYAPYPFANAVKEDFARNETFLFPDSRAGPYRCEVRTVFAPEGDGFALLTALPPPDGWKLKVVFHNAHGPKKGGEYVLNLFPPVE